MNKQNIVIKIAKITRLTGEIKYYIDVNGFVDLDLFVPDIMYLDSWMEEIYAYVLTDKSQRLEKLITNIGFNDAIEKYIQNHRNEIKPSILEVLENYFFTSRELFTLCEENSIERKGKYINLIEPLAKAQIAELLDRAIGAGILDKYNPQIQISAESGTKRSIFRQKNKTKRSKKRLHTTLIKPEQKVNEDLCSGFIVS